MQKINIIGNIFGSDGYSSHTRQLANTLHNEGAVVRIETAKFPGWEVACSDAELVMINREFDKEMTTVYIGTPPNWRFGLMDNPKKFYGFCVWEGEFVPKYWIKYMMNSKVDGILVPSEHVKKAIMNTYNQGHGVKIPSEEYIKNKIHIVPHGVDINLFKPNPEKHDKFTFLVNKGWSQGLNDRGGVQYAIKAFCEEFKKDEPVCLKVKINMSYAFSGWDLAKEIEKLELPKDHAELMISTTMVEYKELPKFYNSGDVFVNSTRAEAFSIPGLEAKACGLPTIQTGYGGQTDYMQAHSDFFIEYDLEEVTHDIAYEENKWATPRIEHLKKLMRTVYENKNIFENWSYFSRDDILNFTWRNSAKKLMEAIR